MIVENSMTAQTLRYIVETYGVEPEFLWARTPNCAAFRHRTNRKWFGALMMETPRQRLGLDGEGCVDILDVKCDPKLSGGLRDGRRYLPGYHMNKEHWLTIVLDSAADLDEICRLIDLSYALTK